MTTTAAKFVATAAQDIRPGQLISEPDGRMREVRDVKYGNETVVLVYTAGPCDVFRRSYLLNVMPVGEENPCANCGRDLSEHDLSEYAACRDEHREHLGASK